MRTCVLALCVVGCATRPSTGWTLLRDRPVEHTIAGGQTQTLDVTLEAGQVVLGTVEQRGADVVITVIAPSGARLAEIDSPSGDWSTERFRIDATTAGTYQLSIKAFPKARGSYRVRVDEITTPAVMAERAAATRHAIDAELARRGPALVATFVPWAAQHGHDVTSLDSIVGQARVIAFGEGSRSVHEYLAYRNRLFQQLVEHHGVTAFIAETSVVDSFAVDDYVLGTSSAPAASVARGVSSWAVGSPAMKEDVELVEWMRAYNTTVAPAHALRFYGIDVASARTGNLAVIDYLLQFLERARPALHQKYATRFDRTYETFSSAGYAELSPAERTAQTALFAELVGALEASQTDLVAATSELAYTRAHRAAIHLQQIDRVLSGGEQTGGIRHAVMAENAQWAIDREGAAGKAFLSGSATHVRRGRMVRSPRDSATYVSMGQHLASALGDQLVVIGSTHGGDDETVATFDALLGKAGKAELLVDLREAASAAPAVRKELSAPWDFRYDAWRGPDKAVFTVEPLASFDVLVYFAATSLAQLTR